LHPAINVYDKISHSMCTSNSLVQQCLSFCRKLCYVFIA